MYNYIIKDCEQLVGDIDFSYLRNKRILITGASGIVGLYMAGMILPLLDSHNIDLWVWSNKQMDEEMGKMYVGCKKIQGDICDEKMFSDLPTFDIIIHSAGYGQPTKFLLDRIKTIQLNTISTINLFNKLEVSGKFLFLSSSEIYNGIEDSMVTEKSMGITPTDHPRSCYIEGKKCGEAICNVYKSNGYDVKIGRLCLAYGPGVKLNDDRAINTFIKKAINGNIALLDNGTAIRTYIYIVDAVEMLWNILLFGKNTTYNIGGLSKISIYDLAHNIAQKLNCEVILPDKELPLTGSPQQVNMNCDKYLSEFEKKEFTNLSDGLDNTICWHKLLYENNNR